MRKHNGNPVQVRQSVKALDCHLPMTEHFSGYTEGEVEVGSELFYCDATLCSAEPLAFSRGRCRWDDQRGPHGSRVDGSTFLIRVRRRERHSGVPGLRRNLASVCFSTG